MATPDTRSELIDTLSAAVRARTCVVLVGMPGSGRRVILRALGDRLSAEGWSVRTIRGYDPDGRPLDSLALSGLGWAAGTGLPTLAAAAEALASTPAGEPLLLLIEEGDRLDETSAGVVAAAANRPQVTVVAATTPPYPGSPRIEAAFSARETTAVWMPTLPFDEVHRLMSDALAGEVDADAAGRIYALSGGLPGVARAIAVEARRAGRLQLKAGRWSAHRDLWTPALAVIVARFAQGLTPEQRDAAWVLAELGPTEVDTVRRILPWAAITALDDRGLVRFVESDTGTLVALFPPVIEDHLRHRAHSAHGQAARHRLDIARPHLAEALNARRSLDQPLRWSASPEAAAILGRLLRDDAAARVVARRAAWEAEPTTITAVGYLQSLLDDGAPAADLDRVLAEARLRASSPSARDTLRLRVWEAVYLGAVRHEPQRAMEVLREAEAETPEGATVLNAVGQHLRLVVDGIGVAELPPYPTPDEIESVQKLTRPLPSLGLPAWHEVDVVRLVRGEVLLSGGRTGDAVADFSDLSPTDPLRRDPDSVVALAQLCHGDIDGAIARSLRQLDLARGTLDRARIEPHAYVVALGLYLRGRLGSLRDHLTGVFAVNAPAGLAPDAHAGLLSISATLSLWEGNRQSAQAMIGQISTLRPGSGPFPLMSADAPAAELAVMQGVPGQHASKQAWDRVQALINTGHLLAAVFDGVRLVDVHLDQARAAQLSQIALAGQGTVLPALGALLEAGVARSPEALLRAADVLREAGLLMHGVRAYAMAIRQLREDGRPDEAAMQAVRLRTLVMDAGDELRLLLSATPDPASELTAREREVTRLIAEGLSNREVAERLVLSERTVDNHAYRAFRKLGITSRDELSALL